MSFVINTNTLSLTAQQNLNQSQKTLNSAIERLSSGSKINSAKDDAAGQAISNRMTSQINGLQQASSNANDGISLAQTAEGALNQINDNLQRVRELTVQAQNGTNSASDIDSIQQEVNERLAEITRVTEQTEFNGISVLEGSGKSFSIQVGAQDDQTISITMNDSAGWNLAANGTTGAGSLGLVNGEARSVDAEGFDVLSAAAGSATAAGLSAITAGNEGANGLQLTSAEVVEYTDTSGKTAYALRESTGNGDAYAVTFDVDGNATLGAELSAGNTALANDIATDGSAAVADGATITVPGDSNALSTLDAALKSVDEQRSGLGAAQNRLDSAINNIDTTSLNISSARSRITDADYATEVSNMSKAQILQQAGTSVLAQANQTTQGVLSLLR
ncbi:flagellin [Salinisphaera sp. S4-8]|uniref:FliC/FljB family flagellin n=1 Tax=Salinisphaera sp. S4-8 TaxID=633357 RepID=UPI0033425169